MEMTRKGSRRPTTQEEIAFLKERRASQYTGTTAHFSLCVFNLMNAILGSGILGLAYAMTNLGYALFTILLVLVAALAYNSIRLLLIMCDLSGISSYEAIGEAAFGKAGKITTILCILTHTIGAMCSFLFIVKYELPEVLRLLTHADECSTAWYLDGDIIVILVTVVIVMPLAAAKNIGFLGYTSGFAMMCMIFFTGVIIAEKFIIPCPLINNTLPHYHGEVVTTTLVMETSTLHPSNETTGNETIHVEEEDCSHKKSSLQLEFESALEEQTCEPEAFSWNAKSAYAVPTMVFAFQCHASVLPIYTELDNPTRTRMKQVTVVSIGNVFVLYFLASLFGYLTFYSAVGPELLLMYSEYDPDSVIILISRLMVLTCVIFSTPLLHYPCRKSILELFFANKPFSWGRHLGIMVCLLTLTDLLVIFVPSIRVVFGIVGSTSASMLVIILPSLFYISLANGPIMSKSKFPCLLLVIFGVAFMVLSLTLIIVQMASN